MPEKTKENVTTVLVGKGGSLANATIKNRERNEIMRHILFSPIVTTTKTHQTPFPSQLIVHVASEFEIEVSSSYPAHSAPSTQQWPGQLFPSQLSREHRIRSPTKGQRSGFRTTTSLATP